MAVQLVRALSPAQVIATDVDASKLDLARELGATAGVQAGDEAAAEIRELTCGRGAALVLDCVGNDATLALDAQVVQPGGAVMVIGWEWDPAAQLRQDAVRREHHPLVLGERDRAR